MIRLRVVETSLRAEAFRRTSSPHLGRLTKISRTMRGNFPFHFPASPKAPGGGDRRAPRTTSNARIKMVSEVVDDDALMVIAAFRLFRALLESLLKRLGCHCCDCTSR